MNLTGPQDREVDKWAWRSTLHKVDSSAFQESERYATGVIETMGIEQLARFGDSDVAASVIRVPSVTVQDSKKTPSIYKKIFLMLKPGCI